MKLEEFAACTELYHFRFADLPNREQFNQEFKTEFTEEQWAQRIGNVKFQGYLTHKGIEVNKYITPEMLRLIDALLDHTIPHLKLKLAKAKVSADQYSRWRASPVFLKVLREKTEKLPESIRSEMFTSLIALGQKGDMRAIKFYFELTGEHTDRVSTTIKVDSDARKTVHALIEVMQRHIPAATLAKIVAEFEQTLTGLPVGNIPVAAIPTRSSVATYANQRDDMEVSFDVDYEDN